jgi:hypothetical protein
VTPDLYVLQYDTLHGYTLIGRASLAYCNPAMVHDGQDMQPLPPLLKFALNTGQKSCSRRHCEVRGTQRDDGKAVKVTKCQPGLLQQLQKRRACTDVSEESSDERGARPSRDKLSGVRLRHVASNYSSCLLGPPLVPVYKYYIDMGA